MNRLFLACTPRSGNVWFRRMAAGAIPGLEVVTGHTPESIDWDRLPPDSLVAMHWRRTPEFHDLLDRRRFDILVTTRHPLDVLISILQFSQHEPATAQWLFGEGGDESPIRGADPASPAFLEYALSARAAALLSVSAEWLPFAKAVARYEHLVVRPEETLGRILRALGHEPPSSLREVVEAQTLTRLREYSIHHFWRGEPGLWKRLITPEYAHQIYLRHKGVFDVTGYRLDEDHALAAPEARDNWRVLTTSSSPSAAPGASVEPH